MWPRPLDGFRPAIAVNHSIFGIVIKLREAGVAGMTNALAGIVAWIYTAALVVYTYLAARRVRDRFGYMLWSLVVLQLAALRSPFAPDVFAVLIPSWIVTLVAIRGGLALRIACALLWLGFAAAVIKGSVSEPMTDLTRFVLTGAAQIAGFATLVLGARTSARAPVDAPAVERTVD